MSTDGAGSATAVFTSSQTNQSYTITKPFQNGGVNINAKQLRDTGVLPNTDFIGSVAITVTGGGGTGIMIVNNDNATAGLSAQMLGVGW